MNDTSTDEILVERHDGVAVVTLNRPDKMNAMTSAMQLEMRRQLEALGRDDSVRVIVLTGAGKGFCAGADMGRLTSLSQGGDAQSLAPPPPAPTAAGERADFQHRYAYFAAIPKPMVACINGAAVGIGLVYALFCDLRFAAENATLMTGFARRGLIAEHGSAWALSRIVGVGHANDLLLSSRKVSGREAERMGLVNRALPAAELMDFTLAYARDMAANTSPLSLRRIKRQMWDVPYQTLGEHMAQADALMQESLKTEDFKEGVAHFMEKRAPRFTGR